MNKGVQDAIDIQGIIHKIIQAVLSWIYIPILFLISLIIGPFFGLFCSVMGARDQWRDFMDSERQEEKSHPIQRDRNKRLEDIHLLEADIAHLKSRLSEPESKSSYHLGKRLSQWLMQLNLFVSLRRLRDTQKRLSSENYRGKPGILVTLLGATFYVILQVCYAVIGFCYLGPTRFFTQGKKLWATLWEKGVSATLNSLSINTLPQRLLAAFKTQKPLLLVIGTEFDSLKDSILEVGEYRLISCKNTNEAFEIWQRHQRWLGMGTNEIQCILVNAYLEPEMTGLMLIEKIRNKESFGANSVPFIVISEFESQPLWEEMSKNSVSAYLKKPANNKDVLRALQNVVLYQDTTWLKLALEKQQLQNWESLEKSTLFYNPSNRERRYVL